MEISLYGVSQKVFYFKWSIEEKLKLWRKGCVTMICGEKKHISFNRNEIFIVMMEC